MNKNMKIALDILSAALPILVPAQYAAIVNSILDSGASIENVVATLRENGATEEQLAMLDAENEVDVYERIRQLQGAGAI